MFVVFYWVWRVFNIREYPFQHSSLQHVTSTQGPLLLSPRNLSLKHVTSMQIRQFYTSLKQKLVYWTQIRHLWKWRVEMKISVEATCRSGGIENEWLLPSSDVSKWRIKVTGVWKWGLVNIRLHFIKKCMFEKFFLRCCISQLQWRIQSLRRVRWYIWHSISICAW